MSLALSHAISLTLSSLPHSKAAVKEAMAARVAAYNEELARVRYNDGLCQNFAGITS